MTRLGSEQRLVSEQRAAQWRTGRNVKARRPGRKGHRSIPENDVVSQGRQTAEWPDADELVSPVRHLTFRAARVRGQRCPLTGSVKSIDT